MGNTKHNKLLEAGNSRIRYKLKVVVMSDIKERKPLRVIYVLDERKCPRAGAGYGKRTYDRHHSLSYISTVIRRYIGMSKPVQDLGYADEDEIRRKYESELRH